MSQRIKSAEERMNIINIKTGWKWSVNIFCAVAEINWRRGNYYYERYNLWARRIATRSRFKFLAQNYSKIDRFVILFCCLIHKCFVREPCYQNKKNLSKHTPVIILCVLVVKNYRVWVWNGVNCKITIRLQTATKPNKRDFKTQVVICHVLVVSP